MPPSVPAFFGLSQVFSGWNTDQCQKSTRHAPSMTGSFFRIFLDFSTLPRSARGKRRQAPGSLFSIS